MITKGVFLYISINKGQPVQPVYVYVFMYVYVSTYMQSYLSYLLVFILLVLSLPCLSSQVTKAGDRSVCNLFVICQNHACLFYYLFI